ncbi:hypothetical protein IP90_01361 [Luteimonas cucumeris]|uniref:Outer membrane beta-barrel porin/alpha-amylase n=1 Tax=Luteimonas cucumeris TaxID=985012 RepID=A0A562L7B6_9GAMM|nr:hypothetical protein [Luteimonas cucumeris]TWI03549.1 hypothetical protein IP90_01361 [Luteimonas cucumeris]
MNPILRHAMLGTAALCAAAMSSPAQADEDWEWMVAPYGWAAGIDTDLRTRHPPLIEVSTETDFGGIIDKIDSAFQIHIEGQGEHFGVFTDFTLLGLADQHDRPRFHTESDLDTRLFELAATWSPDNARMQGLDVFAGLRYIDVDLTVKFVPANPVFPGRTLDNSKSFSDFMLGARYTWALSERWKLTLRGDGSFGDTEGTWNASAVAQYRMKRGAWLFGYRHLSVGLETRSSTTDIIMSGPMVGYGFIF